jgi:hypothetical protein
MSAILAWLGGTKVGRWIAGIGAVVVAMLGLFAVGWLKGRKHEAEADQAKDAAVNAQQAKEIAEAVQRSADAVKETNDEIAKMPDAGTQRVADAAPDSAAGWLRANANRDQAGS